MKFVTLFLIMSSIVSDLRTSSTAECFMQYSLYIPQVGIYDTLVSLFQLIDYLCNDSVSSLKFVFMFVEADGRFPFGMFSF